jgi:hypothetical protein
MGHARAMDMRLHMRFSMAAGALLAVAAATPAAADELDRYVGKYPFDKVGGRSLYQVAAVKRDFVAKFGERRWSTLLSYTTAAPIEAVDDPALGRVLAAWQCKPHDCPNQAVVLLQPAGPVLGACFAAEIRDRMKVEWLAPGKVVAVNRSDCGENATDYLKIFKSIR